MPEYGFGLIPSPKDVRDFKITDLPLEAAATLPPRYLAWTNANKPVVLNQGNTPMCVAYSNSATRQFQEFVDKGTRFDFNEAWLYKQCKAIDGIPNTAGTYIRAAMKIMKDKGFPTVRYSDGRDAPKHKISAYYAVPVTVNDIKRSVKTYGPVNIGSQWFKSWLTPMAGGRLPAPDVTVGGHATVIWGWDDTLGCFYVRNSWGSNWGRNGDFLLPYSYIKYIFESWRAIDLPDKEVTPPAPPAPEPSPIKARLRSNLARFKFIAS